MREPRPAAAAVTGGDPEPSAEAPDGKTILICEDESSLRELVRAVLGSRYRYVEASDGHEALQLARSVVPDLIALDLMIPPTSGLEILASVRGDPVIGKTPVVVLTAWSHLESAARAAGADRFVTKPFEPAELQAIVRELLRE